MAEMKQAREWRTVDKSEWGSGAWDAEPDKAQWVDEATGMDCLAVRGPGGHWCGYVGVAPGHPLFNVNYSDESDALTEALRRRLDQPLGEAPGMAVMLAALSGEAKARPDIVFDVHGGITFSDLCHEPTEEQWLRIGEQLSDPQLNEEARKYPEGDAARRIAELSLQHLMTFDEWREYQHARRICHIPAQGSPDRVWWFGFDCAHCDDATPAYAVISRRLGLSREGGVYRTLEYVRQQCAHLASQLASVAS